MIYSASFSPHGRHLVSGSADRTVCLWDTPYDSMPEVQDSRLRALACSPDGTVVVAGSQDHTLRMWDSASGEEIRGPLRGHTSAISSVSFSPDGSRFASGALDMTVCVWDAITGTKTLGPLKGPLARNLFVAFSADGTKVTACSGESGDEQMFAWDVTSGICLTTTHHPLNHSCSDHGPLEVLPNAWVVETATGRKLSRLPRTISVMVTVSRKGMLAVGTLSGRLLVMHFPDGAIHH